MTVGIKNNDKIYTFFSQAIGFLNIVLEPLIFITPTTETIACGFSISQCRRKVAFGCNL